MQEYSEILKKIETDPKWRKQAALESYEMFFHFYFRHYLFFQTAEYQKEICHLLEDWSIKFLEIIAFRGSAKSTLAALGFPIWAIVSGKAHFPLLASDTFPQAKQHIANIKTELEGNELLIKDFGPFEDKDEEWTSTNIVLPRYDARIAARSMGQKVRGLRHKQYRPDLLIADDIEDVQSLNTIEQRNKDQEWLLGSAIPALSPNAKTVLIGNLLHFDSVLMRMKGQIERGEREGIVRQFPIVGQNGVRAWPEAFPDEASIERKKMEVRNEGYANPWRTWQREYLLQIVPEDEQEVKPEWIQYYDEPPKEEDVMLRGVGVDLAISKEQTADFTTMVSAKCTLIEGDLKVYILPRAVNERLSGMETTDKAKDLAYKVGVNQPEKVKFWVEDVAYQRMQIEAMQLAGLTAVGVKVTNDKRARLASKAGYIQDGTVLFPKQGAEDLLIQLLGFGLELHDDLVDGLTILLEGIVTELLEKRPGFLDYMKDVAKEEPPPGTPTLPDVVQAFKNQGGQRL